MLRGASVHPPSSLPSRASSQPPCRQPRYMATSPPLLSCRPPNTTRSRPAPLCLLSTNEGAVISDPFPPAACWCRCKNGRLTGNCAGGMHQFSTCHHRCPSPPTAAASTRAADGEGGGYCFPGLPDRPHLLGHVQRWGVGNPPARNGNPSLEPLADARCRDRLSDIPMGDRRQ